MPVSLHVGRTHISPKGWRLFIRNYQAQGLKPTYTTLCYITEARAQFMVANKPCRRLDGSSKGEFRMIPEKLEECPNCGPQPGLQWHYDFQYCETCGYDSLTQTITENLKKAEDQLMAQINAHPFALVNEFHKNYDHPTPDKPKHPDQIDTELWDLRWDLLREEFEECRLAYSDRNPLEIMDALCDIIYVVYGMAIAYGWPINEALAEVHRSNMSKLGPDGSPIKRPDGKILKGPNYTPPDLARIWIDAFEPKNETDSN